MLLSGIRQTTQCQGDTINHNHVVKILSVLQHQILIGYFNKQLPQWKHIVIEFQHVSKLYLQMSLDSIIFLRECLKSSKDQTRLLSQIEALLLNLCDAVLTCSQYIKCTALMFCFCCLQLLKVCYNTS